MEKLGIFYGGKSCEHEVSVITALQAMAELDEDYEIVPVYICEQGWFTGEFLKKAEAYRSFEQKLHTDVILKGNRLYAKGLLGRMRVAATIDVALICMHGGLGEGGGLAGMLEMYGIPHTAAGVLPSALCMDKEFFKLVAKTKGFRVTDGVTVNKSVFESDASGVSTRLYKKFRCDLIVKPVNLGSSVGVSSVKDSAELKKALELAFCYSERALVEKKISPLIELNCAALRSDGELIVSAVEKPMVVGGDFLSYDDKYLSKNKEKQVSRELPAIIDVSITTKIRKTTADLYNKFDLSGIVRVDYLYSESENILYVNEINTVPGSLACYLFSECGISYCELIKKAVEEGKRRMLSESSFLCHYNSDLLSGNYKVNKS